ncbi:MarR family transcriptional regulator [Halobaculum sp. D14]|uniref:DUF7845 domain-containing protein n=1 Tax=Halobaculum sp. D14 TaxID=3421642 RepID=UPI003EBB53FF
MSGRFGRVNQQIAVTPVWHEFAMQANFDGGLDPYFAAARIVADSGGSRVTEFTADGERWTAKLYYQESGVVHPGDRTPQGTPWEFDTIREYRIAVDRHGDEDPTGQQGFNAHIRPRWQGMKVERDDGTRFELDIPDSITEGVNVRLDGSNVDARRYLPLLRKAARALDLNPDHFADPHDSSSVRDAERYVRLDKDASGPVHARDGPIVQLAHVLENDREGYRKLVQNDETERGENQPGFYHTVTLGPERVTEVFPSHSTPKEVKHYFALDAADRDDNDPLAHPKLGASYQVSRWDGKIGVSDDALAQLETELDETVHAVLDEAGMTMTADVDGDDPGNSDGTYVVDPYFPAENGEHAEPPELNLTQIRNEQEHIVVRELTATGGLSPVQEEIFGSLVTDGGTVSPADIAEEHGRHVGSVRRALREIDELVDRKYGEVALKSNYIAEMVHEAVQEAREAERTMADAAGQALLAAERGLDEATSALQTWLAAHDVETDSRREAVEKIRLGEVGDKPASGTFNRYPRVVSELRDALKRWTDAGRDAAGFRQAVVTWTYAESRGKRQQTVADLLG